MKKLFCIALIALLTSLLLCSCGAQGQNASGTSTPTTSETNVTGDSTQAAASFFRYRLMPFMKYMTEMQPATLTPR